MKGTITLAFIKSEAVAKELTGSILAVIKSHGLHISVAILFHHDLLNDFFPGLFIDFIYDRLAHHHQFIS